MTPYRPGGLVSSPPLAARQPAAWVPQRIRALAARQPDRRPR